MWCECVTVEVCGGISTSCTRRALAINCHAPFNDKEGAESKDWKKGKPVRVVCPNH